jgi:hypothetical protein
VAINPNLLKVTLGEETKIQSPLKITLLGEETRIPNLLRKILGGLLLLQVIKLFI